MSMRSGGDAARSLRDEAVVDRERERDSLRRFLFDSLDLDRFLDLSRSLDRDRDRLRFLLCLLLLECLDRDELRLRERPMVTTFASRALALNYCALWLICAQYLKMSPTRSCLNVLCSVTGPVEPLRRFYLEEIRIKNRLLFCPTNSLERKMAVCRVCGFPAGTASRYFPAVFGIADLHTAIIHLCWIQFSVHQPFLPPLLLLSQLITTIII